MLAAATAAAAGLVCARLPSSDNGERIAVPGVYLLVDPAFAVGSVQGEWDTCSGAGNFQDLTAGVEVSLTDEHGVESRGRLRNVPASDAELLGELNDANGFLDGSHMDGQAIIAGLKDSSDRMCAMLFYLAIPVASTYNLEIRNWIDRPIRYQQLQADGFALHLLRGASVARELPRGVISRHAPSRTRLQNARRLERVGGAYRRVGTCPITPGW